MKNEVKLYHYSTGWSEMFLNGVCFTTRTWGEKMFRQNMMIKQLREYLGEKATYEIEIEECE